MNQVSLNKISKFKNEIFFIDANRHQYANLIPLLDEPYRTALLILEYPLNMDMHEVAAKTGLSWQTVKQIRSVL